MPSCNSNQTYFSDVLCHENDFLTCVGESHDIYQYNTCYIFKCVIIYLWLGKCFFKQK